MILMTLFAALPVLQDFAYLTMDDFALREKALLDPQSLWKDSERIVIDEAQKSPQIFDAIKMAVDDSDRRRKFILSGSSNLLLMEKETETLAGRALYFELLPREQGCVSLVYSGPRPRGQIKLPISPQSIPQYTEVSPNTEVNYIVSCDSIVLFCQSNAPLLENYFKFRFFPN
jgi:hypothetical protein